MNLHHSEVSGLAQELSQLDSVDNGSDVFVCPAFPYLHKAWGIFRDTNSPIVLGAQDFYAKPNGAFTGEVSLSMLQDVGVRLVLTGHSERRHVLGETNNQINEKVLAALEAGFEVVLCIGETLEQRQSGKTDLINAAQLTYGLAGVATQQLNQITIAYEPVWAIGTGCNATPVDAQKAQAKIRDVLAHQFGSDIAESTRILYGGSVNPQNAADLFAQPDIDGGLVGGASLKSADFLAIVSTATGTSTSPPPMSCPNTATGL